MNSFDFVHLRSPLQSINKLYNKTEELIPEFEEGLYLASSEFWSEFRKYHTLDAKGQAKMDLTFAKYWSRSCSRATPYGTFAGTSVIKVSSEDTSMVLDHPIKHRRSIRLDMNYLFLIIQKLEQNPEIRKRVKLYPNNSIYELPFSYRYAEYTLSNNVRSYLLTSIEKTDYLKAVLEKAKAGMRIEALAEVIQETTGASGEAAFNFINAIWESQLLVSELEPAVSGTDTFKKLMEQVKFFEIDILNWTEVDELIKAISHPPRGVDAYLQIQNKLRKIFDIGVPKNTIQTDLFLSLRNNTIERSLLDEILSQINDLTIFSRNKNNVDLERFKSSFQQKFENQEVSLSVALDVEFGVGYSHFSDESIGKSQFIDGLPITATSIDNNVDFDFIRKFSFSKYNEYLKEGHNEIEIDESDLASFDKSLRDLCSISGYISGSLLKNDESLSNENFIFDLTGIGGPSGGNLLGRFTYGDNELEKLTMDILREEERLHPEIIFAEIVHLPQERLGNILLRPLLREYEISYLGKSGANEERQILIDDLFVSVINNEIILRSARLNKRIMPRLTTAHNFSNGALPIYKFLGDLQFQGLAHPIVWDWGMLNGQKHLPRVIYKNIIVKKARWALGLADFTKEKNRALSGQDITNTLAIYNVPQFFTIKEFDNKLLINSNDSKDILLLLNYIKKHTKVEIEEYLFEEDKCVVKDVDNNAYTNELIIPFSRKRVIQSQPSPVKQTIGDLPQRKFWPNSEWLYFKIYCGPKIAERLLTEQIADFVESALLKKQFEKFYFIRYKDTASHIRVRFFNTQVEKQKELQSEFVDVLQPFIENGMIDSITIDTYIRELERYDPALIEDAESLFTSDSIAVLRFLKYLDPADSEKYRILFGMRGVDMLFSDFGLSLNDKQDLIKGMIKNFTTRFGGSPELQKFCNAKYKLWQKFIFPHMNPLNDIDNELAEVVEIFNDRSFRNKTIVDEISKKIPEGALKNKLWSVLPSYTHMFLNRLFVHQQPRFEFLAYSFLERYYSSQLAMMHKAN
jgi:thiopeptide-type bacteriocin biosynthesis protein